MDFEREAARQRAPSVLIVDQDFMARWQAANYLRECGYVVIEATGESDAISLLAAGATVDVIFAEVSSLGASGSQDLLQCIEKYHPDLPHLLTSGAELDIRDFSSSRVRRIITKPYELAAISRRTLREDRLSACAAA